MAQEENLFPCRVLTLKKNRVIFSKGSYRTDSKIEKSKIRN